MTSVGNVGIVRICDIFEGYDSISQNTPHNENHHFVHCGAYRQLWCFAKHFLTCSQGRWTDPASTAQPRCSPSSNRNFWKKTKQNIATEGTFSQCIWKSDGGPRIDTECREREWTYFPTGLNISNSSGQQPAAPHILLIWVKYITVWLNSIYFGFRRPRCTGNKGEAAPPPPVMKVARPRLLPVSSSILHRRHRGGRLQYSRLQSIVSTSSNHQNLQR